MKSATLFAAAMLIVYPQIDRAAASGKEIVVYRGEITSQRNEAFFRRVAGMSPARIRISSPGGDVEAGIELGYWVFDQGLDIEVDGPCLSSCANYVFPAAANKFILPGGVVAWHGNYRHLKETGLWYDDVRLRMEKYAEDEATARRRALERVNSLVGQEETFFRHIEVDEYLCWIGKIRPHNTPNYYVLSPTDMARFGVDNVQAPPGYATADYSGLGVHIVNLRLPEAIAPATRDERPGLSGHDQERRPDRPEQAKQY